MADLPDSNVWVALSAADHVHAARAEQYWQQEASEELIFCRMTSMALLRLLSSRTVIGASAVEGAAVWERLQRWLSTPGVRWEAEPAGVDEYLRSWATSVHLRGGDWTDAYLAAFSMARGHRLVSFDSGFRRFAGLDWLHLAV